MPFAKWNLEPVFVNHPCRWPNGSSVGGGGGGSVATGNVVKDQSNININNNNNNNNNNKPVIVSTANGETSGAPPAANTITKADDNMASMYQTLGGHRPPPPLILPQQASASGDVNPETLTSEFASTEVIPPAMATLMRISQRTMVGLMRQMSALLAASDQMFVEISDQTRAMLDRSVRLKARIIRVARTIDKETALVRQTYPVIPDIMMYCNLPPTIHWHGRRGVENSLFVSETRPASVQTVYARAHAPGDVRLSSQNSYPSFTGMVRKRIQAANRSRFNQLGNKKAATAATATDIASSEFESTEISLVPEATAAAAHCRCYCGTCHPLSDHALLNHRPQALASAEQTECDCSNQVDSSSSSSPRQSSSASSVVTWSSVTSSVFEPSQLNSQHTHGHHNHHHHHHHHHHHQHPQQSNRRSHPLTSTSSGDYYLMDKPSNGQSAIDAFFRKNPMVLEGYGNIGASYRKPSSVCTCSCTANSQPSPPRTDRQVGSDTASRTKDAKCVKDEQQQQAAAAARSEAKDHRTSNATINTETSHWYWWLSSGGSSMAMNMDGQGGANGGEDVDLSKRWSTAVAMASSPLKPAKFDTETTDWLKENIETRRPESLTILSASDMPADVLLEKALTPLCNNHTVHLRDRSPTKQQLKSLENGEESATLPRLKRRWSLFHRRSKKQSSEEGNNTSPFKRFSLLRRSERPNLDSASSSSGRRVSVSTTALDSLEPSTPAAAEDEQSKEIVLISPEERIRLLAEKYCNPIEVPIDVSGKTFTRMSRNRRSLIHSDFHISRHRIPERRARSKSPIKCRHSIITPYAYGQMNNKTHLNKSVTIERGCQTEGETNNNNNNNNTMNVSGLDIFQTQIDVHQSPMDVNHLKEDEHGDYVVIINARKQKQGLGRMGRNRTTGGGGGHRSSSGNWSAATSDLVPSSPASSLTGIRPTSYLAQCVSPLSGPMSPTTDTAPVAASSVTGSTRNKVTSMSTGNDEVESVYSVDNDGYFTSMHTDSGLYFGTFTLDTAPPFGSHHNGKIRSAGGLSNDKFGRKAPLNRFERIQEEPSYSSESLNPWNRTSQVSLTKTTTSSPKVNRSPKQPAAANELGSNDSINSILSASDVTSIAVDPDDDGHHEETDFDCSVSHCSHQWHQHNSNSPASSPIKRLPKPTKSNGVTNGKLRTVSGTSFPGGEATNAQSALVTTSPPQHAAQRLRKHQSPKAHSSSSQDKSPRSRAGRHAQHSQSIQKDHERYLSRTLTDSSSNSSSCRRLPPPPPPPRVSSMLVTLQRYVDEAAAVATLERAKQNQQKANETNETASIISSVATLNNATSEVNHSLGEESSRKSHEVTTHYANGSVCQSESETNSEYLHASRSEHRRRLFLEVDSTRSYPPLSYISSYDQQTDTATSVSASSSAAYFEDDEFEFIDRGESKTKDEAAAAAAAATKVEKTLTASTDGSSTTIDGAGSSRTLTPVGTSQVDTPTNSPKLVARSQPATTTATVATTSMVTTSLDRDRHFSSPLPPPKLNSFTMDPRNMMRITTDLNTPKHTEVTMPKEKSPPTPAPRNSLHLSSAAIEAELDKIISQTSEKYQAPKELSGSPKHVRISPTVEVTALPSLSPPKAAISSVSPKSANTGGGANNQKGLSTEQMLILLHNSKKKHNIKTQPEKDLTGLRSPTSPRVQPAFPNGKPDNAATLSPLGSPSASDMKRRSWTDGNHCGSLNRGNASFGANKGTTNGATDNQPRTRQSLALDRLGPIRPTTLSDFKRLLSQVRSTPTSPPTSTSTAGGGSPGKSSSVYSALQEVLTKPNAQVSPCSSNSTSGVFSPSSPPSGCLGEGEDIVTTATSPLVSPKATPNGSMNEFIKKFSKSKFLNKTPGQEKGGSRLSAVSRLDTISACPTILEDDPNTNTTSDDTKVSVENNEDIQEPAKAEDMECTNTWV